MGFHSNDEYQDACLYMWSLRLEYRCKYKVHFSFVYNDVAI